jgi:hypothetical protein
VPTSILEGSVLGCLSICNSLDTAKIGHGKRGSAYPSSRMADADAMKTCVRNSKEKLKEFSHG